MKSAHATVVRSWLVHAVAIATVFAGVARAQSRVQPFDRLLLRMWTDEQRLIDTIYVDERGLAVFPRIGAIRVTDFPVLDVRDSVAARLGVNFKLPIDVLVLRKVIVVGEVKNSDVFYVDGAVTVAELIARAGGVSETGHARKVDLVRAGVVQRIPEWDTPSGAQIRLESGDQINVGRRSWLELNAVQFGSLSLAVFSLLLSLRR